MSVKRKVLVTGADGFIGPTVCRQLTEAGYHVVAATRNSLNRLPNCKMVAVGSVGPNTDWSEALEGVSSVVHLVGVTHSTYKDSKDISSLCHTVNVLGTFNLAKQSRSAKVTNFVFISTIKVNGETTLNFQDQMTAFRDPAPKDRYGISKYEAEKLLHSVSGMSRVILRPPVVFGPGQKGNLDLLCRALLKRIPLPLRGIDNRRSFIYVENLGEAVVAALARDTKRCEIFTLADTTISTTDLVRSLAKNLNVPVRLFYIPKPIFVFAAACLGLHRTAGRLLDSLVVDSTDARRTLQWDPKFSFNEGLLKTAKWYHNERG
jgi:nucleoside-diphosphate-sugar epimerase